MKAPFIALASVILLACPWRGAIAAGQLSRQAVESTVDSVWATLHRNTTIPGAVVAVVGPAGLILVKGYGVRNAQTGEPVDPQSTLFQIGSVTKLFTAILALRAVDAGRLTLDEDLRKRFPDLVPPDGYSQPVTVRQLLAHEGGFDGDLSAVMTAHRQEADHLDPVARARHFRRVRPPGIVAEYDNTGVGLLGDVAARSFGYTYRQAMQLLVFRPLGMIHSSIGVPPQDEKDAAACHRTRADGSVELCPHTFMRVGFEGAGALATSGEDMAQYLMWVVSRGQRSPQPVLSAASFARYVDLDQNRFAPGIPGMGSLIEETVLAGHSALYHTGGYGGFSSGVYVLPEAQYGIFVSVEQYADLPKYQSLSYIVDLARRWPALARNNGYKAVSDIATAVATLVYSSAASTSSPAAGADPPPSASPGNSPSLPPAAVVGFYRAARTDATGLLDEMLSSFSGVRVARVNDRSIAVNGQIQDWLGGGLYKSRKRGRLSAFKRTVLGLAYSVNSSEVMLQSPWTRSTNSGVLFLLSLPVYLAAAGICALIARKRTAKLTCRTHLAAAVVALVSILLELQYYGALYYSGGPLWLIACWRIAYQVALLAALVATFVAVRALAGSERTQLPMRDRIAMLVSACSYLAVLAGSLAWAALL